MLISGVKIQNSQFMGLFELFSYTVLDNGTSGATTVEVEDRT